MKNLYYYNFYFLTVFSKLVNKRNTDYAFSGMSYLTLLMGSNVFTILSLIAKYETIEINPIVYSMLVMLPIMGINYLLLIRNNKSENIINLYAEKWKSKEKYNSIFLIFFLIYVVLSVISCGYTAYLIKNHLM